MLPTGNSPVLRRYQARVLLALLAGLEQRAATFTVMFPRQAGKNEVSAALVAAVLLQNAARGGSIVVCAPTLHPQAAISLARTRAALDRLARILPAGARVEYRDASIRVGRATAAFLSASPEAKVAGHTASLLLLADEAQDIDADWFDRQFRPMAASTGAPAVLFGTAWDGRTLLEREVERNRVFDASRPGLPYLDFLPRHHQVSWREVAASRPAYGDYVRRERERLGATHPLFLTQYELTQAQGVGALFRAEEVAALLGAHLPLAGPVAGERYVAGLDFGGEGDRSDRTVLTIARAGQRAEVIAIRSWQGASFSRLVEELQAELTRWRPERICADATGMGGPLCAQLERGLGPRIVPVTFTASTKSAMGFDLLAAAKGARLALHADDGSGEFARCVAELRACRSNLEPGGGLRWFAPPGEHDDHVASLALCLKAAAELGPARVAVGVRRKA